MTRALILAAFIVALTGCNSIADPMSIPFSRNAQSFDDLASEIYGPYTADGLPPHFHDIALGQIAVIGPYISLSPPA